MINLLPPQQKEGLEKEENFRLTLILGVLLFAFLICFSLILFAFTVFLTGEMEAQEILFNQRKIELESPQMQRLEENLVRLNTTLIQLESFYQGQLDSTDTFEQISKTLPLGTYLTNLTVSYTTDKNAAWRASCSLSGFSPNRKLLLEFKENLEQEENFQEIYFPPTNWVQPENINFSAAFKIK